MRSADLTCGFCRRDSLGLRKGATPISSARAEHIEELVRVAEGRDTARDELILRSWRRCIDGHKLDPTVLRPAVIVEDRRLREHREVIEDLLHTARFGVEALYRQVAGLGYVLLLTDHEGITVDYIGDEATTDYLREAGLYLGADWNEARAGTNGTGTCIATGEALTVHQDDHFDAMHIPLTCTVAPIFDPVGNLSAVLDISALRSPREKSSQYLALQIVKSFAHRIETANLIRSCSRNWIVKLTSNQALAEVDIEHVLVLDSSGRIVGFNHHGRRLLAQELRADWREESRILGRPFSDFFDCEIDGLTRFVAPNAIERNVVRLTATGRSLFIQVVPPATIRVLPSAVAQEDCKLPQPLRAVAGEEASIQKNLKKLSRLLNTNMSILVNGETGTGKEYLAKAIHQASARARGPFIPVNCAALPENLIESELFGYESGSFTGALAKGKKGLIREAHGGTLFLDEIGDMPLSSQTRLLRVLAEREVTPIGGSRPSAVDMRVIAATHRDLLSLVKSGRFREDLYFRLNGATISLPPLRERSDLSWIVMQLLEKRPYVDGTPRSISPQALGVLASYDWPGNIRELVNVVDFACAVASDPAIDMEDLPDQVFRRTDESPARGEDTKLPRENSEAAVLREDLRRAGWNVSAAARLLGIDRTTLHRRMRRLGVTLPPRAT
ncbi:sigma-54-dependent Fis family transcriptional regulator [Aestuariivirga sp.]|uniref:sigma-54-dependent Fis family transcriptional regulator n=1 Tax=Aestuariivirga sp. TaxID=2650926 RepID=UPI00391C9D12